MLEYLNRIRSAANNMIQLCGIIDIAVARVVAPGGSHLVNACYYLHMWNSAPPPSRGEHNMYPKLRNVVVIDGIN
jgi:hypothetical protein